VTMRHVWKREVGDAGYKRPLRDAGPPTAGPNRKFDVYLGNIGAQGFFGYCASEPAPGNGHDEAAYCVLDEDFSPLQFPDNTPLENLQVTAAHEFFHAIQFAYDAREDLWMLEGTATWMEDEVYDAVDDNRNYLESSPLTRPGRPLDKGTGFFPYGTWLWWRFLSEQHPADGGTGIPRIIRRVWEAADDSDADHPGTYSLKAVRRVLAARGSSLTDAFAAFGVANRQPQASYEEGEAYDAAPLADTTRLSATNPAHRRRLARVDHLATRTVAYLPGDGLAQGGWRLRARVEVPAAKHSPVVSVTTFLTNGTASTERLKTGRDQVGVAEVGFDSDTVRRVELTFGNAGHRYNCHELTSLSCRGLSKSNDRGFAYRVRLTR
jgi:hypothetical protein